MLKNKHIIASLLLVSSALAPCNLWAGPADGAASTQENTEKGKAAQPSSRSLGEYLSGRFARTKGDTRNALHYLQDAYKLDPANPVVGAQLRDALIQESRMDEAVAVAQSNYKLTQKEAITNLLLTLDAVKKKDFAAARKYIDSSADAAGGQLWLPLVAAWVNLGAGDLKKPLTLEGLSANVGNARGIVNYHLGLINAAAGHVEAAATNFAGSVDEPTNAPTRVIDAVLRFNNRNNSPKALQNLVQAYLQANPNHAINLSEPEVTAPADGIAEVLFTMASIALRAEMPRDAVVYLQLATFVKPQFSLAAVMLGSAYEMLEEFEKSNAAYAKVPKESEFYTQSRQNTASNLNRMGKTEEAMALLDAMSKESASPADALMIKGDLLRSQKRFADAAQVYTQALEKTAANHPMRWALFFARGVCLERQGKWEQAEADLKQALTISPNQPDVQNYLGYGWLERGQHLSEAKAMIEKAVKARPDDAQILDSMGWALYLTGRYQEAVNYMEKAVHLLPGDPEVNSHLGDVYWRVGRKNEARFQWERALAFKPDDKLRAALEKKLKEGLPAAKPLSTADAKAL